MSAARRAVLDLDTSAEPRFDVAGEGRSEDESGVIATNCNLDHPPGDLAAAVGCDCRTYGVLPVITVYVVEVRP